jgi:hypothetical protein
MAVPFFIANQLLCSGVACEAGAAGAGARCSPRAACRRQWMLWVVGDDHAETMSRAHGLGGLSSQSFEPISVQNLQKVAHIFNRHVCGLWTKKTAHTAKVAHEVTKVTKHPIHDEDRF